MSQDNLQVNSYKSTIYLAVPSYRQKKFTASRPNTGQILRILYKSRVFDKLFRTLLFSGARSIAYLNYNS
ncbi:hypothetical protein GCM10022394_01130 [Zobellella aerophila]|uniref:Uncharacterized protein n=1 Tax=Zobellella aerophila TaxID=870480 RepID=A0ABP6V476_9GAMM